MIIARQSTARTVMVGPVLDADGVAVTDCVVADFEGSVNGGDPAALNGSATLTHRGVGFYSLALTATDLATVGSFEVTINDTVNACPMKELTVIEEAVYDALYAASATGALPVSSGGIAASAFAAGAIDAAAIANGAIDAATFAADVDAEILSYLVDDATRIDASALNAASVTSIPAILVDTGTTLENHLTDIKGATFSGATDSLEAIRDRGDAAWATATGFSTLTAGDVNAEVDAALADIHLDHLLAVTYDPAGKPGAADALLNELVESDAGVSRFTANALEQGPSGGGGVADWTADERTAIRAILGIPASGTTPEDVSAGILDTIRDAVAVVDGNVDAVLADTGTDGVVVAAGSKTGYTLTATTGLGNQTSNITGSLSGSVGSVTGNVGGNVQGSVGSVAGNGIDGQTFANGAAWLGAVNYGTASAGGASTVTLQPGASETDDFYNGLRVVLVGGTGAGQSRLVTDYAGATLVATVSPAWATAPDNTTLYELIHDHDPWASSTRTLTAGTNISLAKGTGVTGFNDLSAADVNAEVVDALTTDTYAQPTGVPGATASLAEKVGRLYQALTSELTVTATAKTFYSHGGAALWKKTLADSGTEYSETDAAAP